MAPRKFGKSLATALALTPLVFPVRAVAQQSADDAGRSAVAASSRSSWPTVGSINAALSSLDALGSASLQDPPPGSSSSVPSSSAVPALSTPESIAVEEDRPPNLERWTIFSPAMGRNIEVQVLRRTVEEGPAPMLYLLDGVDAPRISGWLHQSHVDQLFAHENVTLVMPTGAYASMYADWHSADPVLGRNRWETFLAREVPRVLEDPAVYLSAAEGAVTPEEEEYFSDRLSSGLVNGVVLEWGSLSCTVGLDEAMRASGMTHQKVDILPEGVHNWPNFTAALMPAWDHISPALYRPAAD